MTVDAFADSLVRKSERAPRIRIDSDLASALSLAENLRLMADYTASEIETEAAPGEPSPAQSHGPQEPAAGTDQGHGLENDTE